MFVNFKGKTMSPSAACQLAGGLGVPMGKG